MAHRLSGTRPGLALGALLAIVVVTAGWWALALWPTGGVEPEWLERTRLACFGSPPGGLPNTGGWLVLVGQPLGMVAYLLAVWPDALRADLLRWWRRPLRRGALAAVGIAVGVGIALAAGRVEAMRTAGNPPTVEPDGILRTESVDLSGIVLVDQHGVTRPLDSLARSVALLTAAFAHCQTICPTIVRDLQRTRAASGRDAIPLVIVTVDPWRDTPGRLSTIARDWDVGAHDLVLSGDVDDVEGALDRLGVARTRDERTGDVIHRPVTFRLDSGRVVRRLDGGWGRVVALMD